MFMEVDDKVKIAYYWFSKEEKGDTVLITVYRNSKGKYKLEPGPTPIYFLAFVAMIPLGLIGFIGLSKDLIKYHREEKEGRRL